MHNGEICDAILGYIVGGELTFEGKATTEDVNITILCPNCGVGKVWFPQPRKILAQFGKALVDEFQRRATRRSADE